MNDYVADQHATNHVVVFQHQLARFTMRQQLCAVLAKRYDALEALASLFSLWPFVSSGAMMLTVQLRALA